MTSRGTVRVWHADEGWGVLDAAATPGGCWTHYSVVRMRGHRHLEPGARVVFECEEPGQGGYAFSAVAVWPEGVEPGSPDPRIPQPPGPGYTSRLVVRFDPPHDRR